jgi:uncharacterized protein YigE (DUF2233 family)
MQSFKNIVLELSLLLYLMIVPTMDFAQDVKIQAIKDTTLEEVIPLFNNYVKRRKEFNYRIINLQGKIDAIQEEKEDNQIIRDKNEKLLKDILLQLRNEKFPISDTNLLYEIGRIGCKYKIAKDSLKRMQSFEVALLLLIKGNISDSDSVLYKIGKVGCECIYALDNIEAANEQIFSMKKKQSNVSKNLQLIQDSINWISHLIPIAAKKHNGGYSQLMNRGHRYLIFVADLEHYSIQLHLIDTIKKQLIGNLNKLKVLVPNASMLTNAGIYKPDRYPQGLYISIDVHPGKFKINLRDPNNDNFYLLPNGVFFIDTNNSAAILESRDFSMIYKKNLNEIKIATQSGPMLVVDGKIHPEFRKGSKNLNIRSGVGIIDSNKVVFVISKERVNFFDFASFFKDIFGCKNALYLDGAISEMYIRDLNEVSGKQRFGPMISVKKIE